MNETVNRCTAIVLAAGAGKRMQSNVAKQYMTLLDKPVIYYGLQAFETFPAVDGIIVVVGAGETSYMKREILDRYGFQKILAVVEGGAERFLSVQEGLKVLEREAAAGKQSLSDSYVLIHDGARPLVTQRIIEDTYLAARNYGACCAAVPVKDTIKIADEEGFALETPDRNRLYAVQTPQAFALDIILEAHNILKKRLNAGERISVTDDAMVVESMLGRPVKLVEASYENIKLTTPEDMEIAERLLQKRRETAENR